MARKSRVSVPNGTYHVTSRAIGKAFLFKDDRTKDEIVRTLYASAEFSGVELMAWTVMSDHVHILVHVPPVPRNLWTVQTANGEPPAHAFGMRPPACNAPLWSPDGSGLPRGDSPRPSPGFDLADAEMQRRLARLYGVRRAKSLVEFWTLRCEEGHDAAVAADRARYLLRMYNLSQFVKTFNERVAAYVKKVHKLEGHLFGGRFHSGLVEDAGEVRQLVQLYVDYNPYRAGMVDPGRTYRWSSFGQAEGGGEHAVECRAAYEKLYGRPWEEVRRLVLAAFATRLPSDGELRKKLENGELKLTLAQAIQSRLECLSRGHYIGRGPGFVQAAFTGVRLSVRFPHPGFRRLNQLNEKVDWKDFGVPVSA